jgi:predicted ArsR family transcriptional regulator
MSSPHLENYTGTTAERVIYALKTRGPQTVAELEGVGEVCGEAIRQQLVKLAADGLVEATSQPRGVGRPAQVWSLTRAAHARFPDAHARFVGQLLRVIRSELGEDAIARVVRAIDAEARANYRSAIGDARSLDEKVSRLAEVRSREGYMAECLPDGDGYLMIENHCPIQMAASTCELFCSAELATFRAILGPEVTVEPTEHIVNGDRRCAYRIQPTRRRAS